MLEVFAPVRALLQEKTVRIDNFAFRLHCRTTVLLLVMCIVLITAKQYFGEPISCITDGSIERDSLNAYCWIYGTFTVSRHLGGIPGRSVVSPGVGGASETDESYHHRYYQWVWLVLGVQAILFYAPRALWASWEQGLISTLTMDLATPFSRDPRAEQSKSRLLAYFPRPSAQSHDFYAFGFTLCELLNFFNTIGQIYLLDIFLEGRFREYGAAVIAYAVNDRPPTTMIDPMARLFPKVSKCTFRTFGATGSLQVHDALCVLALNVVNEKIFVFLWFWLIFLATAGFLAITYRALVFSVPSARTYLLRATMRRLSRSNAERIVRAMHYGDWFLLRRLTPNIDPFVYTDLIESLANSFKSIPETSSA